LHVLVTTVRFKMLTTNKILKTMRSYYEADVKKHAMAVEVIIRNPMAFHDHDAFYEAIESQLKLLMESKDYLEGLDIVRVEMETRDDE
jgi:hypothetical protein